MAQISTGLRGLLGYALVYEGFQKLIGSAPARARFMNEFIRPFPGMKILDIGCGPGTILEYFPVDTDYVGYDNNPQYIKTAISIYGNRAKFFCADAGAGEGADLVERDFDIVLASGLLHHLEDHEAAHLVKSAWTYLKPGGVFVTNDGAFTESQTRIARFIVSKDRGQNIRTPEKYVALLSGQFQNVEGSVINDLLRIPYTHFIMRATKS